MPFVNQFTLLSWIDREKGVRRLVEESAISHSSSAHQPGSTYWRRRRT
jgi:hypothetical protein